MLNFSIELRVNPIRQLDSRNRWIVSWSVLFPIILILVWDTIAHTARYDYDFLLTITFGQIDSFSDVLPRLIHES